MARKKKLKSYKKTSKKSHMKGHLMPLAIGAIVGNLANNIVNRYAGNVIPMSGILTPVAIGFLANYMKSDYSNGIIAASVVNAASSISKQFMPGMVADLMAGEEYVIQGQESSDPLLGADYLYGEEMTQSSDELGADQFVVSGSSSDPLD